MAQMNNSLARSILNGSGITRWEVEQLCHWWLKTHGDGANFDFIDELQRIENIRHAIGGTPEIAEMHRNAILDFFSMNHEKLIIALSTATPAGECFVTDAWLKSLADEVAKRHGWPAANDQMVRDFMLAANALAASPRGASAGDQS